MSQQTGYDDLQTHIRQLKTPPIETWENQYSHRWAFSKIRDMITYKAKAVDIQVDTQDEAYTSQTCPSCGHLKKTESQNIPLLTVQVARTPRCRRGK
jgi:transposase